MLTDLQRLDYAEFIIEKKMTDVDRDAYFAEKLVTETTDIDVINQLVVDLKEQDAPAEPAAACEAPAEEAVTA